MKRSILLLIAIVAGTILLRAQGESIWDQRRLQVNFHLVQHIGLGEWSDAGYVAGGLPPTRMTEIRGVFGLFIKPALNLFGDLGVGIMPSPVMKSFDLGRMPLPNSGTQYYLREMLSESGTGKASARFKLTAGWFGDFRLAGRWRILPYAGVGGLTMAQRSFEMILKEEGSNMQYRTTYAWGQGLNEYDKTFMLGYLTGRLNVRCPLTEKLNLLLGLEYTHIYNAVNFYARYSNTFNENIRKEITVKGNEVNMIGISITLTGN